MVYLQDVRFVRSLLISGVFISGALLLKQLIVLRIGESLYFNAFRGQLVESRWRLKLMEKLGVRAVKQVGPVSGR